MPLSDPLMLFSLLLSHPKIGKDASVAGTFPLPKVHEVISTSSSLVSRQGRQLIGPGGALIANVQCSFPEEKSW